MMTLIGVYEKSKLLSRAVVASFTALCMLAAAHARDNAAMNDHTRPIVIAHRGASGYLPEHTLAAYYVAVEQGADYIEPDLVMSKDGVLIVRHENEISATTDVAARAEFAARKTSKSIDGVQASGWFSEDFTLAELKSLRVRERIPELRPDNARFDGMFQIATFEEVLQLAEQINAQRRRNARKEKRAPKRLGVYPETKHPSYFAALGLPMEQKLVRLLHRYSYRGSGAAAFIQSFEAGNLKKLRGLTRIPLVQLIAAQGQPYDFTLAGDARSYADLAQPEGLRQIARYADAVGVQKDLVIPRAADDTLSDASSLVQDAHDASLRVHVWTFRAENAFLPSELRQAAHAQENAPGVYLPGAHGGLETELARFFALGVDGVFCDQPDIALRALNRHLSGSR